VTSWLDSSEMSYTVSNELVAVSTTVGEAEKLLGTSFFQMSHPDHGIKTISGLPRGVPHGVAGIFGLRGLPLPKRAGLQTPNPSPTEKVTPAVIASTYSITGVSVKRGSGNTQAVAEFQGQLMDKEDLSTFFSNEVPTAQPGDDQVSRFVGVDYKKGEGVEALLDIEFIMGISPGIATEFWEWPNNDFCGDLLNFTGALLKSEVSVMSISYGWQGNLSRLNCEGGEVDVVDTNWAKLAAKGVSVMISSGDSGSGYTSDACDITDSVVVHGTVHQTLQRFPSADFCCQIAGGTHAKGWSFSGGGAHQAGNCTLFSSVNSTSKPPAGTKIISGGAGIGPAPKPVLYPSWPASSPWVTSVGATRFSDHVVGHEEMASDQFGSGGGFSTRFNQSDAPWQVDAVAAYVSQGATLPKFPDTSLFPAHGRATPDVSALGEGYQVYTSKGVQSVGGTSASSPAFAGLISLINDALLQAGKPRLGFLNPFLYTNSDAFTDVTKGTNAIGRGTGPAPLGYAAAPGWDAATGLGTPIFSKLLAAALA